MQGDVSLKALRYFMAATQAGSIAEAAKTVNVVPSAVHTAINQVEASFGLQLTLRSRSKGISLTATGQQMVDKIQYLLDEYESLLREGGDMRTQLTGTLKVGYYAPAAPAFMPTVAQQLLAHNNVSIKFFECDNQSAQDGLISGLYDVIICVSNAMKPGITYETLLEVPAHALVPASHPFAKRSSLSISELADQNIVLLDLPVVSEYYANQFELAQINPNILATATSLEMVRSLVGSGVGCSILHMVTANEDTYAGGRVRPIPFYPAIEPFKIVLGHLPNNPRRLIKMFVEELRAYFKQDTVQKLHIADV